MLQTLATVVQSLLFKPLLISASGVYKAPPSDFSKCWEIEYSTMLHFPASNPKEDFPAHECADSARGEECPVSSPPSSSRLRRPGRISGTALPYGVHLSDGVYGSASALHLLFGGAYIIGLGAVATALTYIEAWLVQTLFGVPLAWAVLDITLSQGPSSYETHALYAVVNVIMFANFLVVLRLSMLSGYHAAEHKTVTAMEKFGELRYDDVVEMPRAHPRCGTVLLFGLLPPFLIIAALGVDNILLAGLIALIGWHFRYHTGFFVQQYFTTKPPTEKQLQAGIHAGEVLLAKWRNDPYKKLPWLHSLWVRGLPQMIMGLVLAMTALDYVGANLHHWLDF